MGLILVLICDTLRANINLLTWIAFNRSVVLITLTDRLIRHGVDKSTLGFIHDYLAARLSMLKTIEVSTLIGRLIPGSLHLVVSRTRNGLTSTLGVERHQ